MQNLLTAYGVDWTETMDRFMNDTSLYVECLDLLLNDESIPRLEQALNASDLKSAFEAAHSLKGASANMGLTPLTEIASKLTESLRVQTPMNYSPLLNSLREELSKIESIRRQIAPEQQTGGPV